MNVGPEHFAVLSALVFGIGLAGLLTRSNPLSLLMSVALLLSASVLALVGFTHVGKGSATPATGDALAFLGIVVIAAEGAVGAGVALLLWRRSEAEPDDMLEVDL